jgi:hypothetical protein
MRLNDGKYLCPFCVSSWDCDGPHIEEKYLENFYERLEYIREDLADLAKEEVIEFAAKNNIDLLALEKSIYSKIMNRVLN